MTLHAQVCPLSQIDQTLCDVRAYVNISREAARIVSFDTRAWVQYVINVAYENANDTVIAEGACAPDEWARIFLGTLAGFSVDALHRRTRDVSPEGRAKSRALKWFHNRGIVG
jgi:hypothetical protein